MVLLIENVRKCRNGTSLSEDTSVVKFYEDPISFCRYMGQIVEKCPILQCKRICQKVPVSGCG